MIAIAHEMNNVKFQFHKFITRNEVKTNQIAIQTTNHNKYDHLNPFFKDLINIITDEITNQKKKAHT
jgi:GTP1/Obg family GTP-binding protein